LRLLAEKGEGLSGRGIFEVCKNVERKWGSKFIRGEVNELLPEIQEYLDALDDRIINELY